MIIGVPKEIKIKENRVGMTPSGVKKLVSLGHSVIVEKSAGVGSGFSDEEYKQAGAKIAANAKETYRAAGMIVKIKEPLSSEFSYIQKDQIIFTYLHLAAVEELTKFLLKKSVTGIAYETVELKDGSLPLLAPMSQVAGRMSVQVGAHFLEKTHGGRGVLLGGVEGVKPGKVVVLGYGVVSQNATQMARGLGAEVLVVTRNINTVRGINSQKNPLFRALVSTKANIAKALKEADLVVSGVLIPGASAPKLVTEGMIREMKPGSVIVDVAIDQGGSLATSCPTSHTDPVFNKHGVIHYCVTNMPGAVPRTSTLAITQATLPYIIKLAEKGFVKAVKTDPALAKGVNTYKGYLTYQGVAEAFGLKYTPLEKILNTKL